MQLVHQLLRARDERVALGPQWRALQQHFELAPAQGKWLTFTREQREALRAQAGREWGFDPLAGIPDGTRQDVAADAIDEKIAGQRPDDQHVLLKGRLPGALPTLSPELSLRVPIARLDLSAIPRILLIENLDSFDHWQLYQSPAELSECLVLYRGHGGLARGARRLLASLPAATHVTVFADYDPAGLAIAVTLPRADALLLPQLDSRLLSKGSRPHFERQYRNARHLDGAELGQWQDVWAQMKQHGVSIKQQHMLALAAPLHLLTR
jgi:hypothetical protein